MAGRMVRLTIATNPLQRSLIEGCLRDAGVSYSIREGSAPSVILGETSPVGFLEFRVAEERLQEAKDLLCANGVVCEVSERLLRRCLDEIVKPQLGHPPRDLQRLVHFVEINNRETLMALYAATLDLPGGVELLQDLFFRLVDEGLGGTVILARRLRNKTTRRFHDEFLRKGTVGDHATRTALIEVIPEFRHGDWAFKVLQVALLDPHVDIREAGSEALFALAGQDFGYDPEGPVEERETAVQDLLGERESLRG